jgi:hypothetical protein
MFSMEILGVDFFNLFYPGTYNTHGQNNTLLDQL